MSQRKLPHVGLVGPAEDKLSHWSPQEGSGFNFTFSFSFKFLCGFNISCATANVAGGPQVAIQAQAQILIQIQIQVQKQIQKRIQKRIQHTPCSSATGHNNGAAQVRLARE